mmetsp:Transcript_43673/g.102514  ORF Transcript_43673/g.102514 Transcript_43673/m.102514 type:complete len:225 (-) Transcript_43673:40-714(-)
MYQTIEPYCSTMQRRTTSACGWKQRVSTSVATVEERKMAAESARDFCDMLLSCDPKPTTKPVDSVLSRLPALNCKANEAGFPATNEPNDEMEPSESTEPSTKHAAKPTRRCRMDRLGMHAWSAGCAAAGRLNGHSRSSSRLGWDGGCSARKIQRKEARLGICARATSSSSRSGCARSESESPASARWNQPLGAILSEHQSSHPRFSRWIQRPAGRAFTRLLSSP